MILTIEKQNDYTQAMELIEVYLAKADPPGGSANLAKQTWRSYNDFRC